LALLVHKDLQAQQDLLDPLVQQGKVLQDPQELQEVQDQPVLLVLQEQQVLLALLDQLVVLVQLDQPALQAPHLLLLVLQDPQVQLQLLLVLQVTPDLLVQQVRLDQPVHKEQVSILLELLQQLEIYLQ
jgi:hypothetical protein